MLSRYQVLCVGSATVDHFLTIKDSFKEINVGDKVLVQGKATHTGGEGNNGCNGGGNGKATHRTR